MSYLTHNITEVCGMQSITKLYMYIRAHNLFKKCSSSKFHFTPSKREKNPYFLKTKDYKIHTMNAKRFEKNINLENLYDSDEKEIVQEESVSSILEVFFLTLFFAV